MTKLTAIKILVAVGVVGYLISSPVSRWWLERREHRFDSLILEAGRRYQVHPALIKAVIWQESRFQADALGTKEEIGLMQVREDAAFEWADAEHLTNFVHAEILDPEKNIRAGTFYLGKVLKRYRNTDNPLPYALADYNAGRANVLRWSKGPATTNAMAFINQIEFPMTRRYAISVMDRYRIYREQFSSPTTRSR